MKIELLLNIKYTSNNIRYKIKRIDNCYKIKRIDNSNEI